MKLTPEQLEMRRLGIGSSEIGAVVGLDDTMSPWRVWAAKRPDLAPPKPEAEEEDDSPEADSGADLLERGHRLELPVAQWWADDHHAIITPGATTRAPRTIAISTPDFIANWNAIGSERVGIRPLEVKTTGFGARGWGDPGTDQVPGKTLAQCQWHVGVYRLKNPDTQHLVDGCEVTRLDAGLHRLDYFVPWAPKLFTMMLEVGLVWWERHVIKGEPPPPDASAEARAWIRSVYPEVKRTELVPANGEDEKLLAAWLEVRDRMHADKKTRAALEALLTTRIADAGGLSSPWGELTWKNSAPAMHAGTWKALALEALDAYLPLAYRAGVEPRHEALMPPESWWVATEREKWLAKHLPKVGPRKLHPKPSWVTKELAARGQTQGQLAAKAGK